MKNLLIIGAGGVGREVSLIVQQINRLDPTWNLIGFFDDNYENWGKVINGYTVIGGVDNLEFFSEDHYVIIAISNYKVKKKIVERLKGKFKFATIVHPNIWIHDFMTLGEGSIVYDGVVITSNVEIGKHVIISPKCGIGHDSKIKDYVSLLWNVNVSGNDIIGEGVMMGTGSTIIQEKHIKEGAIIGAGALVIKDIDEYCTAVGVPAEVIKRGEK